MVSKIELSVVIPAYMEEENLRCLLPRLQKVLSDMTLLSEVLVVDTIKPRDNSKEVCEEFGINYLNRTRGDFYGDAVREGIKQSQGEYILFMDADGSHSPEFIHNIWREHTQADVVIASRYVMGGVTDNNRLLVAMSLIVNLTYAMVLGIKCKDVSNSFKLYRASFLKELDLKCNNFDIIEEILFKLIRQHKSLRLKEIPFSFKKRMFGNTKRNLVQFAFSFLVTLLRLRFMR